MEIEPYPLTWPAGYPRTDQPRQSRFEVTMAQARDGIIEQLQKWKASAIVISSDAPVRRDGIPYATTGRGPKEAGVAVYFTRKNEQWVIPCDEYEQIRDNMQAIRYIIEAFRTIERHGGAQALRSASAKFKALPETGSGVKWWEVLEVSPDATEYQITMAWKAKIKKAHPDHGGSVELMQQLQEAYGQAMARFKNKTK